ncbi:prephenate dehydratase [Belliella baltica DSM 15883]|uniref:prephenate dehydratase n=1 Tax=Belliella baltica (strain DSM 15883 / CIP 108006 / LMG 21964 / BA134) TaxID=866536 RepID=I3Z6H5_BELBD|nr:prephenate dehydratase domain-containing protein [Belliella baltica]AFL84843.1 prephenate dehydratase [Belliella baltica DSM 15883]
MKISIQGIPGSFHHQVALNCFGEDAEILGFRTFEEAAKCVSKGECEFGILAIENSIAGAILPNYELIDRYNLTIKDEYYLPISHNLMCLKGQKIDDITEVRSHPMALLQCKKFFEAYPNIKLIDDIDTASVSRKIRDEKLKNVAAIASTTAAKIYGLEILAGDIQTVKNNFTRFIILQKPILELGFSQPNKASIKVTVNNEKGILAKLLSLISSSGLDLSKIQSIPVIDKPWEYAFFIDLQFENYQAYQSVIQDIKNDFGDVKIFGEYENRK